MRGVLKLKKGISKGVQLFKNNSQEIKKTYVEAYEEYILSAKFKGRSEDTIRTYKYHSRYFIEVLGANTNCREITLNTIEAYILYLKGKNVKSVTINSYLQNISPIDNT